MNQLNIDFTPRPHRENNAESQAFADANTEHFSEQCEKLYKYMKAGHTVNLKTALMVLDIWDLRRRIKDLKDKHGVTVYDTRMPGGYKEYALKPLTHETANH